MFDLQQSTLFGPRTISTIGFEEQQLIRDILHLHCNGKSIDCDPTYSIGNFYKQGLPQPKYKFDIEPQLAGVEKASAVSLPLEDRSIDVEMFDPPFVIGGQTYKDAKDGLCVTAKRFGNFASWKELTTMYRGSMKEAYRILRPNGVLIFKNQDCVAGGKNYFTHVWIMNTAIEIGFYPKDLIVLLAKNRIISEDPENQQHARKFHSYFWVFEKKKRSINYSI